MSFLLFLWLFACNRETYPKPVVGTAYRIDEPKVAEKSEITLFMFSDWADCANAGITEIDACVPFANRQTGEVKLSFELRDPQSGNRLIRSVKADDLMITHDRARQEDFTLTGQEGSQAGQLYILLIDVSASMYENDGAKIKKVYEALLNKDVIDRFFPKGGTGNTGVAVLRFNEQVLNIDGKMPMVQKDKEAYKALIKDNLLKRVGGYSNLFNAVKYSTTDLLKVQGIQTFLQIKSAEPTIILLTDGFNSEKDSDTCETNVERLNDTNKVLRDARTGGSATYRPTLYTVGLGRPYQEMKKPPGLNTIVNPDNLCGEYKNNTINQLEHFGIDHISLEWLAESGGGASYIRRNASEIADVFKIAAAQRHSWYTMRYRVPDPFYHRKSFETEIRLSAQSSNTKVLLHPNAWFDAPPGIVGEDGWSERGSMRSTAALVMPTLGILVLISFLGAATYNARRAVFRRGKPRK